MYDRIQGVLDEPIGEGTHFRVPWFQTPNVMDIRTRPRSISSVTGTKGGALQGGRGGGRVGGGVGGGGAWDLAVKCCCGQFSEFLHRLAGVLADQGASSIQQALCQGILLKSRVAACSHTSSSLSARACLRPYSCFPVLSWAADLQMVNITLRVLSKPDVEQLPRIFRVRTHAHAAFMHLTRPRALSTPICRLLPFPASQALLFGCALWFRRTWVPTGTSACCPPLAMRC